MNPTLTIDAVQLAATTAKVTADWSRLEIVLIVAVVAAFVVWLLLTSFSRR